MSGSENVQWLAPVLVLLVGAVIGAVLLIRGKRTSQATADGEARQTDDLQNELNAMISRLRELAAAGASFDTERLALEREAATLLRQLSLAPAMSSRSAADTVAPRKLNPAAAMVWLTGAAVVFAVMYIVLMQSAAPRDENAPVTGGMPTGDTTLAALQQQLAAEPQNLDLRVDLARAYLERGDMQGVFRETQEVLQRDPEHARALSYHALAVLSMGDADAAHRMLQRAVQKEPDLIDAWVHLSLVHTQRGDRDAAIAALDNARSRAPQSAEMLDTLRREIEARFAAAPAPAAAGGSSYRLRITGDAAARGTLFIALRPAGVAAGPPVAVKRFDSYTFPLDVEVSDRDSMQGGSLPATARVDVRIDRDGNAMTRDEGEPRAAADNIVLGSVTPLTLQ